MDAMPGWLGSDDGLPALTKMEREEIGDAICWLTNRFLDFLEDLKIEADDDLNVQLSWNWALFEVVHPEGELAWLPPDDRRIAGRLDFGHRADPRFTNS